MKIVCWNMAHSRKAWDALVQMEDVDIALLQESSRVPEDLRNRVAVDDKLWDDHRLWPGRHMAALGYPSVVARLSDRVSVRFIASGPTGDAFSHDFYTSEWGTLGAAIVSPIDEDESLIVVSMAPTPTLSHASRARRVAASPSARCIGCSPIFRAWSAARVASSPRAIGSSTQAGVLIRLRSGTNARHCISRRPSTGCRRWAFAQVMPEGRRSDRGDVVTFRSIGATPAEAWAQADYVFATENIADRVSACALNSPEDWGPSDHCRLVIDFD